MSIFDEPPVTGEPPSTDLVCEVCNAPLIYTGRGRKPKRCDEHKTTRNSSTGTRTTGSVPPKELEQACGNLRDLYDTLALPLVALNPRAGQTWVAQIDGLDKRNHTYLANNRDLCKRINATAAKGGSVAFALSHVIAVAPVVLIIVGDGRAIAAERRAQREAEQPAPGPVYEQYDGPADPFIQPPPAPGFFDIDAG